MFIEDSIMHKSANSVSATAATVAKDTSISDSLPKHTENSSYLILAKQIKNFEMRSVTSLESGVGVIDGHKFADLPKYKHVPPDPHMDSVADAETMRSKR